MDLSLPRFTKLDDGVIPKTKPWPVAANSPASPTSAEDGNRTRTPSPCMDLDELSSDGSVTDASPQNFKVTLLYDSEDSCTPVGSIVFSSDEDLPLSPGQEDRRKVRKRDTRPLSQPGLIDGPATEPTPMERPVETKTDSLMDKPPEAELPAWSDTEIMPLIIIENSSVVEKPKTTDGRRQYVERSLIEQGSSGRYHFVTTVGSTYTGLEDHRSGSRPVSYTDGRKASAVVSKLYLLSVGRERNSAGTDGLVIATVYQT